MTTQFLVVTAGPGQPASGTLTEYVNLATTLRVTVRHTHRGGSSARFSGAIAPSEAGGRVSLQRLVNGQWQLLAATTGQPAAGGISTYAMMLHIRHGGYYRVYAAPVEDGHAAGRSAPVLVHVSSAAIAEYG